MMACPDKEQAEEQAMSEKTRKTFTGPFKAKVALEAIRGVKTVNEIAQGNGTGY